MQQPGVGEQSRAIQLGLLRVQRIVVFPKLALFARAASRFGRSLGLRMDFPQREVQVCELYAAVVLGEKFLQSRLALLAIRTLKVGELDDCNRGFGISLNPRRIVRDVYAGWPQQNRDFDLRSKRISVDLAGLLQLKLL